MSPAIIQTDTLSEGKSILRLAWETGPFSEVALNQFAQALERTPSSMPVLMVTHHADLPLLTQPVEQTWLLASGAYRTTQENFKARGGCLISLVTGCLIGGPYLIHGMAAQHRLAYTSTSVYPSLPAERYESLFKHPYPHPTKAQVALEKGVLTQLTSPHELTDTLSSLLANALPA